MKHPCVYEVLDVSFWAEKNALPAIWHPTENPMPVALKEAYKSMDAGYHEGMDEKNKSKTESK